jgi:hypothetical protein
MNKSNHFDLSPSTIKPPEHSPMTTVNILSRLRLATEHVRQVQSSLDKDGK